MTEEQQAIEWGRKIAQSTPGCQSEAVLKIIIGEVNLTDLERSIRRLNGLSYKVLHNTSIELMIQLAACGAVASTNLEIINRIRTPGTCF